MEIDVNYPRITRELPENYPRITRELPENSVNDYFK